MMIRSFLPVGQGAFYTEQFACSFGHANIIYDCGSLTDVRIVEKEISHHFQQGEYIDAVFISHFDEDHMNGLPYLLKHCRVKKLFFPLITKEGQDAILLSDLMNTSPQKSNFLSAFVTNPYDALSMLDLDYHPTLYQIQENTEDDGNYDIDGSRIPSGKNVSNIVFDEIHGQEIEWMYVPFNFRETARIAALKAALQKNLGKAYSCTELLKLIKNGSIKISDVKQAYKDVPGSFNTNSMTVLSASQNEGIVQFPVLGAPHFLYDPFCTVCNRTFSNGCLYTGDFDAQGAQKWKELSDAYDKYDCYIGCVQIPHHGSRYSYNHQLLNIGNCTFYIISAGEKNKYRHPHGSVIKDILINHKYPIIVTESSGSAARFLIDY